MDSGKSAELVLDQEMWSWLECQTSFPRVLLSSDTGSIELRSLREGVLI